MSDILAFSNSALDKLPLFATDHEIAVAVVGKERAIYFKSIMAALEREGFPPKCKLHGGRPVFLVKLFYQGYFSNDLMKMRYKMEDVALQKERAEEDARFAKIKSDRAEKQAEAKARSERAAARKREALEQFRAKKAAEARNDVMGDK